MHTFFFFTFYLVFWSSFFVFNSFLTMNHLVFFTFILFYWCFYCLYIMCIIWWELHRILYSQLLMGQKNIQIELFAVDKLFSHIHRQYFLFCSFLLLLYTHSHSRPFTIFSHVLVIWCPGEKIECQFSVCIQLIWHHIVLIQF